MFATFDTLEDFDEWRDGLWVPWHAARSAWLAVNFPERGHVAGGALDWAAPRAARDRSHLRYGPHHPRAGQPMDPKPGRAGGLVWVTCCVPGCHADSLIPHADRGGGGVLALPPVTLAALDAHDASAVTIPTRTALDAEVRPREVQDRRQRMQAEGKRARLVLGHRVDGVQLARIRPVTIDKATALEREALPLRARETLEAISFPAQAAITRR